MKMTSALANKMLKQLCEEKEYWVKTEREACTYTAAVNEEPVIPEYDYKEVADKIAQIDHKICRIKHAVNLANVNTGITVGDEQMSIDAILVEMAQLNKRKAMLDWMRTHQPKARVKGSYYSTRAAQPEYEYINYDLDVVKKDFEKVSHRIMEMQMALDMHNQTFEFEVEI